jgi:gas vesicle protein
MEDITSEHTTHRLSPMAITVPFIVGGIAGAAAALLFAPLSGDATRKLMRRKLDETVVSARDLKDRTIRRGQAVKDEATSRVQEAASALAGNGGLHGHAAARESAPL